jgi:hypothetical protein
MRLDLEDKSLRVRVNRLDIDRITDLIYDSRTIVDPEIFKRRKGRVGWYAELNDGDAYIMSIKPSYTNFGELRSQPFRSITPVKGAQLFAGGSEDRELYRGIYLGPWGGDFEGYPDRSARAFRIINLASDPLQGIQTNEFFIDSFDHTTVSFDLSITQQALDAGTVEAFLWNGYQPISLPMTTLVGDTWSTVKYNLGDIASDYLPGTYRLVVVQSIIGTPNDWFIDNISVKTRQIDWEGRAYVPDAWGAHENDWINFGETVNQPTGGVLFRDRSDAFQVRAKALAQQANIGQMRVVPKYAELGRFVWRDQGLSGTEMTKPVAAFDQTVASHTVTLGSTSSDSNGYIIAYTWTLGDGTQRSGPNIQHTFEEAGTYPVTLIVTDNHGERASTTQEVTVA